MNMTQWIMAGLLVLIVLAVSACLWIGNYFYNLALNPAKDKTAVLNAPHNAILDGPAAQKNHESWFLQHAAEPWKIISHDGLQLQAYVIKQPDTGQVPKWAILAHGYTSEARAMTEAAYHFYRRGFSLLMPDARGHGRSEGDYIGMGWHERLDLVRWIHRVVSEAPEADIVLYGVSMGAATVMMTAGEELPPQVKAVVEDCGYTSIQAEFAYQLKALYGLPAFPLISIASLVARVRAGYTFEEGSALRQISITTLPVMFIHGGQDTFVPSSMAYELYEAARTEKELYIVPGAGHGGAAAIAGEEYWMRVDGFLTKYLSDSR